MQKELQEKLDFETVKRTIGGVLKEIVEAERETGTSAYFTKCGVIIDLCNNIS